jgi:hypothetical protein
VSSLEPDRHSSNTGAAALIGLVLVGAALRFWHLGDWNFQATEIFTLRDSVRLQLHNPRPLGYLLNYYLVRPLIPLDEFGLRLLPAIFGVLAIPALYLMSRRLVGTRAALFGSMLVTVNPLLISYSQLARYWSLVFLLSAIYPYALYLGAKDRSFWLLGLGLVTFVLAVLAHPVSALLIIGPLLALVGGFRRDQLRHLRSQRAVQVFAVVFVVLAAAVIVRLLPILQGWVSSHDKNPSSGQFLNPSMGPSALKLIVYLLAFADGVSMPVILIGVLGLYLLWQSSDRRLALLLISMAAFPILFITLISLRTPVSTYYVLPTVPVFFIGAGVFLDRIIGADWKAGPRWLVPATVIALIFLFEAPTLFSDYRNGRRYDFRHAARWLDHHLAPGDIVFSDQPIVLAHYLPGYQLERLQYNVTPLTESVSTVRQHGPANAVWIIAPGLSHALRTNLRQGGLIEWVYDNCQLRNTVGTGRMDFRQQYLQIYRCPPLPATR